MKPYAVVTFSDSRYGDVLADTWYRSLVDTTDLSLIDIIILDYGISTEQQKRMPLAKILRCNADGHVVNLKYRDIRQVCDMEYEQILLTDGGDILFQANIAELFTIKPETFRVVVEGVGSIRYDYLTLNTFKESYRSLIRKELEGKPLINVGVMVAPSDQLKEVCNAWLDLVEEFDTFGTDTVGMNYLLYTYGFYSLDTTYNFLLLNYWDAAFTIKSGLIYDSQGELVKIVHNAGANKLLRPVIGFGYRSEGMKINPLYYVLRPLTGVVNTLLKVYRHLVATE